jgi:hypothetical protein
MLEDRASPTAKDYRNVMKTLIAGAPAPQGRDEEAMPVLTVKAGRPYGRPYPMPFVY